VRNPFGYSPKILVCEIMVSLFAPKKVSRTINRLVHEARDTWLVKFEECSTMIA
jgi:hypothetical protein